MKVIRDAKMREEMQDREASLRRAREEACLADGISWGMGEDAVEEEEVCEKLLFLMMLAAVLLCQAINFGKNMEGLTCSFFFFCFYLMR